MFCQFFDRIDKVEGEKRKMDTTLLHIVANELKQKETVIEKIVTLLEEGNTVPFIARYRKEATGGLDEVAIKEIYDTWTYQVQLKERKEEVIRLIDEQGKLTDELRAEIERAVKLQRVEDLYRPYRQKRRTRATVEEEEGVEALAEQVWNHEVSEVEVVASQFISEEHELVKVEDVLQGVNDIIAEGISDDASFRSYIRDVTWKEGTIHTVLKEAENDEKKVYEMYYDYHERIRSIVSHRTLAINRAEKEDVLRVTIEAPVEKILQFLHKKIITSEHAVSCRVLLEGAIEDSYKRLIEPSVEREIRNQLTEEAEEQAINIFSENMRNLLLQPPLKGRTVLGVDPAFRTGCKLAVVDETGKLLDVRVMFPTAPHNDVDGAEKIVLKLVEQFSIQLIAIGNGTASRETEQFIANVIEKNNLSVPYIIVNEAGASVYSASDLARDEFPDLEVEERSAVSIARRVQDPLAELVKIDPKSIGVEQYQHDVSQKKLNDSLVFVVETAVNQVGVNVNTASTALLEYVAGLSKTVAHNIVKERNDLGKFTSRTQLKKIPRLGPKTYEQGIGFLRILDGKHPLDRTPIHPESYQVTMKLLERIDCELEDIGSDELRQKLAELNKKETAEQLDIGEMTLEDIIDALSRPERDPRDDFPQPLLQQNVLSLKDLKSGMEMQGTVRNVVDFGVFVDIGVEQDGLVHISKMANKFVKHPMDIASVGDVVTVWIEEVDLERGRIALSMIENK